MESIESTSLNVELQSLLQEKYSFTKFRKGQLEIIQSVLSGKDTLAVMPTGGGKSLCYQLPALYKKGIVIVISPLIALMKDQVKSLRQYSIPCGSIHSGQSVEEKKQVFIDLKESENFLLFLSPERVQNERFLNWLQINKEKIHLIAVDEAHCVSKWGHDFREDYNKLSCFRAVLPDVPILALTATATPEVLKDIEKSLYLKNPRKHVYGFYRKNLYYQVEHCQNDDEKFYWIAQAVSQFPVGRVLIYCGTRKNTRKISDYLKSQFEGVHYYHAGLSSESRTTIQEKYNKEEYRILCCTNAFGMGIDHSNVRLVIHFQIPANIESLYQEKGRAGRDQEKSTCLVLFSKKDKGLQAYFIGKSSAPKAIINSKWRALETIENYVEIQSCRQAGILTYFRDPMRMKHCGHCDVCAPDDGMKIQKPNFQKSITLKKKRKSAQQGVQLSPEQESLERDLKEWRKDWASENDVPAFIVFSNKTLKDLCVKLPKTESELEEVYGLGPSKIEKFGAELLRRMNG